MIQQDRPIQPAAVKFDEAALQTGGILSAVLLALPAQIKGSAYEIRIRCGQPVTLTTPDGRYIPENQPIVSRRMMQEIFSSICSNAIYCHQEEIAQGCITLVGGHRAGICGRVVSEGGRTVNITDISSICIRIAHEIRGCAAPLAKYADAGLLIAGPPCSGKTTLLRDLVRLLSADKNIVIIDERNEIAAVYRGTAQLDVGIGSDVLTGQQKAAGILHAVRCMSPDIIVCDEIGTSAEAQAVSAALNTGTAIIATMHCGSEKELAKREQFRLLRDTGAFAKVAFLARELPGHISRIADTDTL